MNEFDVFYTTIIWDLFIYFYIFYLYKIYLFFFFFKKDAFDCIDISDNDLRKLDNFPVMKRLKMLLCANNHVVYIEVFIFFVFL